MNIITNLAIHYGTQYLAYLINRTIEYCTVKSQPRTNSNDFSQSLDDLDIPLQSRNIHDVQTLSNEESEELNINLACLTTLNNFYHIRPFLSCDSILNLSITSKTLRDFILYLKCMNMVVKLVPYQILCEGDKIPRYPHSERLQFAQANNLKIKIKATSGPYGDLVNFINSPHNPDIISRCKTIVIGNNNYSHSSDEIQTLLNLIAEKIGQFTSLTLFKCGHIYATQTTPDITLPENCNKLSFECENINMNGGNLALPRDFNGQRYFKCKFIHSNTYLIVPDWPEKLPNLKYERLYPGMGFIYIKKKNPTPSNNPSYFQT